MPRDERDRFADLFSQLVDDTEHDDADQQSALRLLSHSLLNYLGVEGTRAATGLAEALPYAAAFLDWARADGDVDAVARRLHEAPSVEALGQAMIRRRLESEPTGEDVDATTRAPAGAGRPDPLAAVLVELAGVDRALRNLRGLADDELRDRLIGDSALLAAAVELCESQAEGPVAARLRSSIPSWARSTSPEARWSAPLWLLARLEDAAAANPLARRGFELDARARGFERGLAQNMVRLQLIPAVRAALAFAPPPAERGPMETEDAREAVLRRFSTFRSDPALLQLASALIEVRGRCIDYVRGAAPLTSLTPWVDYLRGPCVELAEMRECTLREAMSYAHYCLHLVNVCDFAARGPRAFNTQTRETLSAVEEELKEFALAGQREGLTDAQADLSRFVRARWRRDGEAAYLADRLSRLRGAWRDGTSPGPMGSPPRVDAEISAHSLALVESVVGESDEADIVSLARLVERARLLDYEWLEHLAPPDILKLIAIAATTARDLAGVDVGRPFEIDLGAIGQWVRHPDNGALNRRILSALLERRAMSEILNGGLEPTALRRGIVGALDGLERVRMQFVADDELSALLELMSTTSAESSAFHDALERRLDELLRSAETEVEAPDMHSSGDSGPRSSPVA